MYKVLAVLIGGISVQGYRLQNIDNENDIKNIKSEDMINLVKRNEIQGVSIVEDLGEQFITGLHLSDLMILSSGKEVTLVDKIYDEKGNVIGYQTVKTEKAPDGLKFSSKKTWDLGTNGKVSNGKSYFVKNNNKITKYFMMEEQ